MPRFTLFLLLQIFTTTVFSQAEVDSSWLDNPKIHTLTPDEQGEGAVVILDDRVIEYEWGARSGSQTIYYTYYSRHMIVHLNTDKSIEEYNKVYIPMQDADGKIVEVKARSISPDGKTVDLKSSEIKELDNYEDRGRYVLFAIDGVQKNGEIEYYYKIRKRFQTYGTEYRRSSYPCREFSIKISSLTEKIELASKAYNGLMDISDDSPNKYHFYAYKLKGNSREGYSADDAVLPRVEFKSWFKIDFTLNYPPDIRTKLQRIANGPTWETMSENVWQNTHNMTPKQLRKARKMVKSQKFDTLKSIESKVMSIENYVKSNFKIKDTDSPDDEYLDAIFKKRVGNATGITRLYMCLFDAYGIKYHLAVTSNRYAKRFDKDFASWSFLHDYLFCFPDLNHKFLSPSQETSRLGFPPQEFICNDALCFNASGYDFREVSCDSWEKNQSNIYADIRFDLDDDVVKGKFEMVNTGYFAGDYQVPYLGISSEPDRQKYLADILDNYSGKDQPKNASITGASSKDLYVNPCILKMDYSSNAILEKAGPKYIFHVGEVIGPQSQLYSDTARVTDVENRNQHGFIRKITIHIPEGYKIINPGALNMDVHHDDKGTRTAEFISRYTLTGDMLVVDIQETYRQLRYPVSQYEDFRKVINAAADFNKVVLFLEKK